MLRVYVSMRVRNQVNQTRCGVHSDFPRLKPGWVCRIVYPDPNSKMVFLPRNFHLPYYLVFLATHP
jgi:hypothetical protein